MGFLDMDDFSQAAEDSTIVPHPLAEKLSLEAKTSYLGMVIFAALAAYGTINAAEKKAIRAVGLSLQLGETDINESIETISGLKTNPEKISFVRESVASLSDRDTAMWLYCDMTAVMSIEGALSGDAETFLSVVAKIMKIAKDDLDFLNDFSTVLSEEKKPEAATVLFKYTQQQFPLPEGLVRHFIPKLDPVRLPGGKLPLGENKFCDGRFIIDSPIIVGTGSKLLMKNAEIEFGINGWIENEDGEIEFADSKLTARTEQTEKNTLLRYLIHSIAAKKKSLSRYLIRSKAAVVSFSGCSFDGAMTRAAISQQHFLRIHSCTFSNFTNDDCVLYGKDIDCSGCCFNHCSSGKSLMAGEKINISKSKFLHCTAKDSIIDVQELTFYQRMAKDRLIDVTDSSSRLELILYQQCKAEKIFGHYSFLILRYLCYVDCVGTCYGDSSSRWEEIVDYETWQKKYEEAK